MPGGKKGGKSASAGAAQRPSRPGAGNKADADLVMEDPDRILDIDLDNHDELDSPQAGELTA